MTDVGRHDVEVLPDDGGDHPPVEKYFTGEIVRVHRFTVPEGGDGVVRRYRDARSFLVQEDTVQTVGVHFGVPDLLQSCQVPGTDPPVPVHSRYPDDSDVGGTGEHMAQRIISLRSCSSPPRHPGVEASEPFTGDDTGCENDPEIVHPVILQTGETNRADEPGRPSPVRPCPSLSVPVRERPAAPIHWTTMTDANRMKPQTAAKKLNIYLPAAPEHFRETPLTHDEFVALQADPPEWLRQLRREGPFPRAEVARKLGVTITALKAGDADRPYTAEEIRALLDDQPEWLRSARAALAARRAADGVRGGDGVRGDADVRGDGDSGADGNSTGNGGEDA